MQRPHYFFYIHSTKPGWNPLHSLVWNMDLTTKTSEAQCGVGAKTVCTNRNTLSMITEMWRSFVILSSAIPIKSLIERNRWETDKQTYTLKSYFLPDPYVHLLKWKIIPLNSSPMVGGETRTWWYEPDLAYGGMCKIADEKPCRPIRKLGRLDDKKPEAWPIASCCRQLVNKLLTSCCWQVEIYSFVFVKTFNS